MRKESGDEWVMLIKIPDDYNNETVYSDEILPGGLYAVSATFFESMDDTFVLLREWINKSDDFELDTDTDRNGGKDGDYFKVLPIVIIKAYLTEIAKQKKITPDLLQLPDCELDLEKIKVIMISEVPPQNPEDDFYSGALQPDYMKTTLGLFEKADVDVKSIEDILNMGIYITTAVKIPKTSYTVETSVIKDNLPILEAELTLFPNLKVIMLIGDVAKKAVNMIAKAKTKKNIIPAQPTQAKSAAMNIIGTVFAFFRHECVDCNIGSVSLWKSLDCKPEGTIREEIFFNGTFHHRLIFGLTANEYKSRCTE